jgi:hypothetical protein
MPWPGSRSRCRATVRRPITAAHRTCWQAGRSRRYGHLVEVLAADQSAPALAACEVISTGTLTRALPITAHETWRTKLTGIALSGSDRRHGLTCRP